MVPASHGERRLLDGLDRRGGLEFRVSAGSFYQIHADADELLYRDPTLIADFGLGVDRVVMMLTGQSSIRDVLLFPLLRPEGG